MAPAKMSEAVKSILDYFREVYGEVEVTAEEANTLYGGSKASKVKDMTDNQVIQYCLLDAYGKLSQAEKVIAEAQRYIDAEMNEKKLNRAQRRAQK